MKTPSNSPEGGEPEMKTPSTSPEGGEPESERKQDFPPRWGKRGGISRPRAALFLGDSR